MTPHLSITRITKLKNTICKIPILTTRNILLLVAEHGFHSFGKLHEHLTFELEYLQLDQQKCEARLEWLCDVLKNYKDKICNQIFIKKRQQKKKIR